MSCDDQPEIADGIAIIGLAARFPGAADADQFWRNLRDGVESITFFSDDELLENGVPQRHLNDPSYVRAAAVLDDIDRFDAGLFDISDHEAATMDPQHRLYLESVWQALEDAGYAPRDHSPITGIYAGVNISTYLLYNLHPRLDQTGADFNLTTLIGNDKDYFASRVAYRLNLQGPAVTVQSACSTSLVAVHQACQGLLNFECDVAVAGGCTVRIPHRVGYLNQGGSMLAADGHCRVFDQRACGTVPGSGVGNVVLKRLSDAVRDGDSIRAVIRSSAINNDGAAKIGYTAPGVDGQAQAIETALALGDVGCRSIGYVETHGTGTPLGDPIEIAALTEVFGRQTQDRQFCAVGSVKSNFGHLECAAGIAGLIKTVLAIEHGQIPPSLGFEQPNPQIDFENSPFFVNTELRDWQCDGPRRAGVSSFGFGGTNCHVVVEEAPVHVTVDRGIDRPAHVLTLSARSEIALRELAGSYVRRLSSDEDPRKSAESRVNTADVAFTANTGRTQFGHRLAVTGRTVADLTTQLDAIHFGSADPETTSGLTDKAAAPRVAFLFSGQGTQFPGMARDLYETQPVFAEQIDRCTALLRDSLPRPLTSLLFDRDEGQAETLHRTGVTQPVLFALEYSLAHLWKSWGIIPQAVLGHSVGEFAAACVAGVFDLEDGLRLIAERGRLMESLRADGAMAAVFADVDTVTELIEGHALLGIAAVNSPNNTVISGEASTLDAVLRAAGERGVQSQRLQVSQAFHSPLVEPALEPLRRISASIGFRTARIPLVSNVTGDFLRNGSGYSADYVTEHARGCVQFQRGIRTLVDDGIRLFVEIGPGTTLCSLGQQTPGSTPDAQWLASLRPGSGDWSVVLDSLSRLCLQGVDVDWAEFDRPYVRRRVSLPTYPFERNRYWIEPGEPKTVTADRNGVAHPLLGHRIRSASQVGQFESQICSRTPRFLHDHRIRGDAVFPGTGYLESALTAGRQHFRTQCSLGDVTFEQPLPLPEDESQVVQTIVLPGENGEARFEIHSLESDESDVPATWTRHCSGIIRNHDAQHHSNPNTEGNDTSPAGSSDDVRAFLNNEIQGLPGGDFYARARGIGMEYRTAFQGIRQFVVDGSESAARISLPDCCQTDAADFDVHPVLLDSAMQTMGAVFVNQSSGGVHVAAGVDELIVYESPGTELVAHAALRDDESNDRIHKGDIRLTAPDGRLIAEIRGLRTVTVSDSASAQPRFADWLYRIGWVPQPLLETADAQVHLNDPAQVARRISKAWEETVRTHGLDTCDSLFAELDALSAEILMRCFRDIGWSPAQGDAINADGFIAEFGIDRRHRRFVERALRILVEEDILQPAGDGFTVVRVPATTHANGQISSLRERFPAFHVELTLMERCQRHLAGILTGRQDPLPLLFPDGNAVSAFDLAHESPRARAMNELVAIAVHETVDSLPDDRVVRVLEIGGDSGALSAHVLPRLPAERTKYTLADRTAAGFRRAQESLGDYPFVEFHKLDLERDPLTQGFAAGSFELIIAVNSVHATTDVRAAVEYVRSLLAPSGVLIMLEPTRPQRWFDLVFGTTEGWSVFTDTDFRSEHPLLDERRWIDLLKESGLSDACVVPSPNSESGNGTAGHPSETSRLQCVVVARGPAVRTSISDVRLVFFDDSGIGQELVAGAADVAGVLVRHGDEFDRAGPAEFTIRPSAAADFDRLLSAVISSGYRICDIVHLWSLDSAGDPEPDADPTASERQWHCRSLLNLTQALQRAHLETLPQLHVVSRGAHAIADGEPTAPDQATVWGMGRCIRAELPDVGCRLIDLDPASALTEAAAALQIELQRRDDENEIAYRDQQRYVGRLEPVGSQAARISIPEGEAWRLIVSSRGSLDNLDVVPDQRPTPGQGEVEIEVHATGLNFRDVLNALGMMSGDPSPFGGECAGRIVAVGDGVAEFEVGQRVVASAVDTFRSHATAAASFTFPIPDDLEFADAVTIPITFLTAGWALRRVAQVQRDETVLIHAGAGGVGLAAIALCRQAGANVVATAGSERKRRFLKSLGVSHVFDSRSVSFARDVQAVTDGRGVDVVLNSLAGDMIPASLSVLAEGGRFVEIGKIDIWDKQRVAADFPHVDYHTVAIDQEQLDNPDAIRSLFQEILDELQDSRLEPLKRRVFPLADVRQAFRHMQQARHIGKVVVDMTRDSGGVNVSERGTWLVTGGAGALGLQVARRLVARGARHLKLLGRNQPSPDAAEAIVRLTDTGADVEFVAADVAVESDVEQVLQSIRRSPHPLRGVIHAAGVFDDGVLNGLTWSQFETVFAAKVAGARNLHTLTRDDRLDAFVLFSSAVSLLGTPGQANYAAASGFLDSLAHDRHAAGLPATAINWGGWAQAGMAAEMGRHLQQRWANWGIDTIDVESGLDALEQLIAGDSPRSLVLPADWTQFARAFPGGDRMPLISRLTRTGSDADTGDAGIEIEMLADCVPGVPGVERHDFVVDHVWRLAVRVLGIDPSKAVDPDQSLLDLGLDSLMAVELRNALASSVASPLPSTILFDHSTPAALADYLLNSVLNLETSDVPDTDQPKDNSPERTDTERITAEVTELTDTELEALISAEFQNTTGSADGR